MITHSPVATMNANVAEVLLVRTNQLIYYTAQPMPQESVCAEHEF
jgi:hypothetical protein